MPSTLHTELLILGSGPAGYAAAVYAARANLRPILISAAEFDEPDEPPANAWPADVDFVRGPALKRRLRAHSERASTRVVFDRIRTVNLTRRPFRLKGDGGSYSCDALIVAVDTALDTRMFGGQLEMRNGQIVTSTGLSGMPTMTSLQGVFVAGDLQEPRIEQLITSTGTACMAALDAQRYLELSSAVCRN